MSLIKCEVCGELFADSYKDCPFCAEDEEYYHGRVKKRKTRRPNEKRHKRPSARGPVAVLIVVALLGVATWMFTSGRLDGNRVKELKSDEPEVQTLEQNDHPAVPSLEMSPTSAELAFGDTLELTVSGQGDEELTWTNSDPAVVTLSEDDASVVAMETEGTAVITVTCGEESAACTVRVVESLDEPIVPTETTTPKQEQKKVDVSQLSLYVEAYGSRISHNPAGFNNDFDLTLSRGEAFSVKVDGTDQSVSWSSANSNIASCDGGTFKFVASGETVFTGKVGGEQFTVMVRCK